jgi:hypothetical protein
MPRKMSAQQQLQLESPLVKSPRTKDGTLSAKPTKSGRRRGNGASRNGTENSSKPEPNRRAPRPSSTELLLTPGALLTRSHLRGLGLERRAIDAVFRALPVVALPGYSRPMIHADQYLELVEQHTYHDDRVRPSHA